MDTDRAKGAIYDYTVALDKPARPASEDEKLVASKQTTVPKGRVWPVNIRRDLAGD